MNRNVVIIGAGQAGAQVAISLRDHGHQGRITLLGDEPHLPYQRPPLSKAFLKEAMGVERLHLKPQAYYDERAIEIKSGCRAVKIDARDHCLEVGDGEFSYDVLVLATGTRPRDLKLPGAGLANVFLLRSAADVEALRPALSLVQRLAIVGGGYIGLEVAAIARGAGKDVTVIEAEDRLLKRVTSEPVSAFFASLHRSHGVELITSARVAALVGEGRVKSIALNDGRMISADAVLLAAGASPNSELADAAGLAVQDGILVDSYGSTSAPDIYACGDCTRFPSRRFNRSVRIESVQNAIDQAKSVAAMIMGNPVAYDPVPWFWSDQYRTKLQIAGLFDPAGTVHVVGEPGAGPFSVEYRSAGRLVAVDAIDNARAHMRGRRAIAEETANQFEFTSPQT
ncbi:MAG: FAD-dependent oxidoreductase [Hyphomicrobiaceae bacterium]